MNTVLKDTILRKVEDMQKDAHMTWLRNKSSLVNQRLSNQGNELNFQWTLTDPNLA